MLQGLGALASVAVAVVLVQGREQESRLLRSDPELLPRQPGLMSFARQRGAASFAAHCAGCHGPTAAGDAGGGTPSLRDADWLYDGGSVADIERVITYGIRAHVPQGHAAAVMPGVVRGGAPGTRAVQLSPGDLQDLVEFLRQAEGASFDATAARRGAGIFAGRGGCYDCHATDAKGDPSIGAPNLTDPVTLYGGSRAALLRSLEFGREGFCPAWRGRLGAATIRETALYVYSLSHGP